MPVPPTGWADIVAQPWRSRTARRRKVPCCPGHARPHHHLAGQPPTQDPGGPAPPTAREEAGVTLIEGYDELSLALDAGVVPRTVYFCPELMLHPDVQPDVVDPRAARSARRPSSSAGRRSRRSPTARGPTGSSPWSTRSTRVLRRPDRRARAAGAAVPGRREAGQPRGDAAHRRRGRRRGGHRRRPGDRLGQPQPGPGQQGHRVLRAGGLRLHRGHAAVAARPRHHAGRHDPGHRPGLHRRRLHRAGGGGRRRREVRPDRRGPRRRPAQGPHPDGRPGELPQRRHVGGDRHLRGGPPARSRADPA